MVALLTNSQAAMQPACKDYPPDPVSNKGSKRLFPIEQTKTPQSHHIGIQGNEKADARATFESLLVEIAGS